MLTINPKEEDDSNFLAVGSFVKKQFQKRRKTPKPTTSKFEKSSSLGLIVKVSVSHLGGKMHYLTL